MNADAHLNLGNALCLNARPGEALAQYQVAAELRPHDPLVLFNWGQALEMLGDGHQAMSKYKKALNLDPQSAEIKAALARVSCPH